MFDLTCKKILLTGGAGFLGRYVHEELCRKGADPKDIRVTRSAETDLRLMEDCRRAADGADLVIHLAARVGGIGYNRRNPGILFYENVIMGAQLMEASRLAGVGKFVQVGTVCAYPSETPVPFREGNLWNGYPEATNAPYGVAKRALLVMAQAYRSQYGLTAIYLLPANLYGPGDNFDLEDSHVIPALVRKFIEAAERGDRTATIWGSGRPTREFLHARDCARAIVMAARTYDSPEPVNLGSGREISIRQLAEIIARECGFEGKLVWDPSRPDGQMRRCLDTSRARAFGFEAKIPLEDGLRETIDWYRKNREGRP